MKRRICAGILCALALLGLTACGGMDTPAAPMQLPTDISTSQDKQPSDQLPVENLGESAESGTDTGSENIAQGPEEPTQSTEPSTSGQVEEPPASSTETSAPTQTNFPAIEAQPVETGDKVLIAYFTWAENTVVEDPSAVDVDATTSASVLAPGHVAQMAAWIQSDTGGDMFSIVTTEAYSSDYDECLDRAADEKAANARPALTGSVANMADYDVVFLGYPDWWATCPMAVFTFLESYDFTGKTVIPFCAHGTSGLASSVRDIKAALPGVTVLDAVGVQRPGMDTPMETARSTVASWLASLEY